MAELRSLVCCLVVVSCVCVAPMFAQAQESDLPELDDTGVVVPWSDFKQLLDDLRRPTDPPPPPPPPVGHVLSACRVTARGDRDGARLLVRLQYTVQILEPEAWVEVPVAPSGLTVEQVLVDRAAARMYRAGSFHNVAFRGAGSHEVVVDALVPVAEVRGRKVATLRWPDVPGIDLDLEVFGADMEFEIDGAVIRSVESANDRTSLRAALNTRGSTTVSWFEPAETDQRDSSLVAEVATLVSIGEGSLRGVASVSLTIHGQGVRQFEVAIPDDIEVLDVRGQGLSDWRIEAVGEGRSRLRASLGFAAERSYTFELDFEGVIGQSGSEVLLPDFEVQGVRRERGYMAVAAATNVEITPVGQLKNAAMVDPSEMPAALAARAGADVLFLFKYLRHPMEATVSVVKHQDLLVKRTIVELGSITTYVGSGGRRLSSARYTVKNNRKQYLAIELPDDSVLWGAFREGKPVKASRRADGAVLVPLKKTSLTASASLRPFDVEVTWFEGDRFAGAIGRHGFDSPSIDVDLLEMEWTLYLPRKGRYFAFSGTLANQIRSDELNIVDGLSYTDAEMQPGKRSAAAPAPPKEEKVDRLEDLEEMQRLEGSQVAASNVAQAFDLPVQQVAGRARGVLPVKVEVPQDGLPLRFSGRLLTAGEAARVSMWTVPAAWRMPRFGGGLTAVLALILTLTGGLRFVTEGRGRWAWLLAAGLLLGVLFFVSAFSSTTWFIGLAAGLACLWIVRWFRNREPAHDEGF